MLKGFFDDSRTDAAVASPNWCVAGFIGDDHHWEGYLADWPAALKLHGVPYYHGKEIVRPKGIYSKWHPLHEHKAEMNAFIGDLTKVITDCQLRGMAAIVRKADLDRFNAEFGLELEQYPLAVYGCMLAISRYYAFEPMELFFDHVEKVDSKLALARAYADSDLHHREDRLGRIRLSGLADEPEYSFKSMIELQAADLIVGDFRKNHLKVNEWFEKPDRPQDYEERGRHFEQWTRQKYGTTEPRLRESLQVTVDGTTVIPWVWDYETLCECHGVRGAPWPSRADI